MSTLAELHNLLKPGDTVYTVLKHRSRSGMQHCIDLYVVKPVRSRSAETVQPICITWNASKVLEYRISKTHGGLVVNGSGMDMGFHVVYNLGCAMWPDGTPEPHGTVAWIERNGEPDQNGGYALNQQWL